MGIPSKLNICSCIVCSKQPHESGWPGKIPPATQSLRRQKTVTKKTPLKYHRCQRVACATHRAKLSNELHYCKIEALVKVRVQCFFFTSSCIPERFCPARLPSPHSPEDKLKLLAVRLLGDPSCYGNSLHGIRS